VKRGKHLLVRPAGLALLAVALGLFAGTASSGAAPGGGSALGQSGGVLPAKKVILKSAVRVDLDHHSVTLPLHRGSFEGKTVWFVLTEASDAGPADQLGLNFAPKLHNLLSCEDCVQTVTLSAPSDNKFDAATVNFEGVPDFTPTRRLVPGPAVLPPAAAEPGAVGDARYSPFIRVQGTGTVYNAPIVAVGDGPFDVETHTNTADRVLAVHRAPSEGPAQFFGDSVEMLLIRGFDSGQPILYLSTEASDPLTAVLERATFVPLLERTPYVGGDDFFGSARERIFPFVNGQTGARNRQAQGLVHLVKDGHATEDASLANAGLIRALRRGGDALNVQGDFPTLRERKREAAYSPLWDATFGMWTPKAIARGRNRRMTDEFEILHLAATRPDLLTGMDGKPYGSVNVLINCPVIGFLARRPREDRIKPKRGDAVDTPSAYTP